LGKKIKDHVPDNNENKIENKANSENYFERADYWYRELKSYIRISFLVLGILTLIWEMMLLSTFLYFHLMLHKLIAAIFAIIAWFLTYKKLFTKPPIAFFPCIPGYGLEKFDIKI
jgi:hypothetical protein